MMSDETFISEAAAMRILLQDGDYTESQARIILNHSRKQSFDGAAYYPLSYISKRARDSAKEEQLRFERELARDAVVTED